MKKVIYLAACTAVAMSLFSCQKSYNAAGDPTQNSDITNMTGLFAKLKVQPKQTIVDAATGGSFYGTSGTRYIIAANSLVNAAGQPITGKVTVQTAEYVKKSDMIFSKMLPVSDGQPLLSGGEFNISVTQNGQAVFLKPGSPLIANVPVSGTLPPGMQFFAGQPATDTTQALVNWVNPNNGTGGTGTGPSVVKGVDSLSIISDSLRLCNADAFMTAPNFQSFKVVVSGVDPGTDGSFLGYTLYDTYKGVWPFWESMGVNSMIHSEYHVPDIPVHFVVFGFVKGKFYGGITGATPHNDSTYKVTLSATTPEAFKDLLNNM